MSGHAARNKSRHFSVIAGKYQQPVLYVVACFQLAKHVWITSTKAVSFFYVPVKDFVNSWHVNS